MVSAGNRVADCSRKVVIVVVAEDSFACLLCDGMKRLHASSGPRREQHHFYRNS